MRPNSRQAPAAQRQAFDRILDNHMLYCTVCDNNNGNCTVHNTTKMLAVEHQKIPFKPKPYEVDNTNPFYRYDPDQCMLCGRCVEACQNVQVNETLSINWEDPHPRVLWDGGATIGESSCVSCGHCVTVCPCNALMEKSMIGHAGFMTGAAEEGARRDDRHGQGDRAGNRLRGDPEGVRSRVGDARIAHSPDENGLHILRRRMQLRRLDEGPAYAENRAARGPDQRHLHLHQREVRLGLRQQPGPADHAADPRERTGFARPVGTKRSAWSPGASRRSRPHGPDALAFISSSKCTNEESYLMQKLARAVDRHEQHGQLFALLPGAGHDGAVPHGRLRRRFGLDHATSRTPGWC